MTLIRAIKGSHSAILAFTHSVTLAHSYNRPRLWTTIFSSLEWSTQLLPKGHTYIPLILLCGPQLRVRLLILYRLIPPSPVVASHSLSGIMLVIPKAGDEPTQTLRFLKSRSTVVHIGRASSSLADTENSPDAIQFRCPVISRKHAKLMFSSGHVSPITFCHPINPNTDGRDGVTHICIGLHRRPSLPSWHSST